MSSGSKATTVGYKYYMGVQLALTHGPVDEIKEFIIGERSAWTGNVTDNGEIAVNNPNLFGGEKREGGVAGVVDVMMGAYNQPVNEYLEAKINGPVPAYRGLLTVVFRGHKVSFFNEDGMKVEMGYGRSFLWSSGNPYFKNPWWRVARYAKGWSRDNQVWYPQKVRIGRDMNPVHMVYECLTNLEWGMGYSPNDMDDASWRTAADAIYAEGFGISMLWMEQTSINDFASMVLRHIDASYRMDIKTGRFQIRLIRNNYDIDLIPNLNPTNILTVKSCQRSAWGDTANEVVVKYTDRNQEVATVAAQDLACIEAQGALISITRDYVGIREPELARRVAVRDLANITTPLAKIVVVVNRVAWDWDVTDPITFTWPKLGFERVPFRILKINKGDLINGEITIEAIEDVFGMPQASYIAVPPPAWQDPISEPKPVLAPKAVEAPYWDVVQVLSASDIAYLPEGYAFGQLLGVKPNPDAYGYDIFSSPNNSAYSQVVGTGEFTPSAIIVDAMPKAVTNITVNLIQGSMLEELTVGTYAYVDDEVVGVVAIGAGSVTLSRGVLDTVPAVHVAGTRIYFADDGSGYDSTQRTSGEVVHYKQVTRNGRGELPLSQATQLTVTLKGRADRPYPPGNVRINNAYYPAFVEGGVPLTWAHRDRLQQTVSLNPFSTGNIGPEPGTTYTARMLRNDTKGVLVTQAGITGTSVTLTADYEGDVVVELWSVREGKESWQRWTHTFFKFAGPLAAPTNLVGTYTE